MVSAPLSSPAGSEQPGCNLELRSEGVVLRLDFRVGEETSLELSLAAKRGRSTRPH